MWLYSYALTHLMLIREILPFTQYAVGKFRSVFGVKAFSHC